MARLGGEGEGGTPEELGGRLTTALITDGGGYDPAGGSDDADGVKYLASKCGCFVPGSLLPCRVDGILLLGGL